jgi:tetratricopeptide (TPR) repeat protein
MVQQALQHIYNLDYDSAEPIINDLEPRIGDHPGYPLLQAVYTNWKYRPLKDGTQGFEDFVQYLNRAMEMASAFLEKDENDVEGIFFSLAAHGFQAQLYADLGYEFKALGSAKNAYNYIKKGFDLVDQYPEFYFPCGIYNYYRQKYPEEHPFYKTFMWIFREGDKEEGIKMLQKGVVEAVFTKAECLTYLAHINLRYEGQPEAVMPYVRELIELYPQNLNFIALYAETLIQMKKFKNLTPLVFRLRSSDNKFYQYIGEIFYAIYLEQSEDDLDGAMEALDRARDISETQGVSVLHYDSMLLLELGRITERSGNPEQAQNYFRLAAKYAEYTIMREEAESYLQ